MRIRHHLPGRLVPALACLALVPLAGLLAGCGGGSGKAGDSTARSAAGGATAATTSATAPAAAARAKASPTEVLGEVRDALAQVRSYHIEGTQQDTEEGRGALAADIDRSGSFKASLAFRSGKVKIVVIGGPRGASYIKGDEPFWRATLGAKDAAAAKLLAGQWVTTPAAAGESFGASFKKLLPSELAYCIDKNVGPLTNRGLKGGAGKPAVVLHDAGGRPATAAGDLYVAATGDALPLRVVQLGLRRKGGKLDHRCYDRDDATTEGSDLRLSAFNAIDPITAPRGAKNLETLLKGAAADTTS